MRALILVTVLVVLTVGGGGAAGQPSPAFVVIVHPTNPVTRLDRKLVADYFLKKATRWSGDRVVSPIDLPASSAVRGRFADQVLRRSVAATRSYWQQIIFSGRGVPPPELPGDAEVVRYVATHPGAIAYVSHQADVSTVKVIALR